MATIEQLRKKIAQTDADIIAKLSQRQELSKKIGELKAEEGKAVVDISQEKKLFEMYDQLSEKYHLQKTMIKRLFKIIISYSRKIQES